MKHYILLIIALITCAALQAQDLPCPPGPQYQGTFIMPPNLVGGEDPLPELPTPPPNPISDLRGIYWVHGLGGDVNSWGNVRTATDDGGPGYPARKTVGLLMTYATSGLETAGSDLNDNIILKDGALHARGVTDFSNNFIIGHSQGGIVSRWADYELQNDPPSARRFYGLVTFGSPHGGAQVVNSRNDGLIGEMAEDACKAVLNAELALKLFKGKEIVSLFLDLQNFTVTVDNLCDNVPDVMPFVLGKLFTGASDGYAVGAGPLGELNGYSSSIHKAAFFGAEYAKPAEDPTDTRFTSKQLLWRTLGSPPEEVSNAPVFTANEDQARVDWANKLMVEYQAEYEDAVEDVEGWNAAGIPCNPFMWLTHPVLCAIAEVTYNDDRERRDIFHDAWRWSQGVDAQWKVIIGAKETLEVGGTCECLSALCDEDVISPGEVCDPILPPGISNAAECQAYALANPAEVELCEWYTRYETFVRESDGVVTANSASGYDGTPTLRLDFANHFQLRNSEQTRDALLMLFGGADSSIDKWFATGIK
jgi:hypothetical protein